MRHVGWLATATFCLLAGCSSTEVLVAHSVPLTKTQESIPEPELLDVGVTVFDSGVPEGEVDKQVLEQLIRDGTFVQIRRTESFYMAVVLRDTLQKTGEWGAVWVTPKQSTAADLNVDAKILHSDGDYFQLHVNAADATGRKWLDKDYNMSTAAGAYNRQRYPTLDPYQDVFNEIANDLAAARARLSADDRRDIRTVAAMRYAADLSPDAFSGYVTEGRGGSYTLNRLPAEGDPMFDRTQRVRQRERLFLETLDEHYDKFYQDAMTPYDSWRENAREEAIEIHEATKSAHWRTGMGVATILASIVYGSDSSHDSFADSLITNAGIYMGAEMLRSSAVRRQEKKLHAQQLEELSTSFEDKVKPMVVDIQGTQHRLTGTAEAQYQEWRDLLRQIFTSETGFAPEKMAIYSEPDPAPAVVEPLPTRDQAQPNDEHAPPVPTDAAPAQPAPAAAPATAAPTTEAVSHAAASANGGV